MYGRWHWLRGALLCEFWDSSTSLKVIYLPLQTVQWLRHGVLPVYVLEGITPEEKQQRLRNRYQSRHGVAGGGFGNGGDGYLDNLGKTVRVMLEAMVSHRQIFSSGSGAWAPDPDEAAPHETFIYCVCVV